MGCSSSVYSGVIMKRRLSTSTVSSVDVLESDDGYFGKIAKRYGHPSYYKTDGYDLGLRYKVRGVFQSYFVGSSRSTGEKVTIKEFHLRSYSHHNDSSIMTEVLFLSKLSHRSLPRFKEIFISDISVFLVCEYVDQMRLVRVLRNLSHDETRQVIKGLFEVLQYLHEKRVVVRELTPSNISLTRRPQADIEIMIADLSMAIELNHSSSSLSVLADHPLFDWPLVAYSSPETLQGCHHVGPAADMWSTGVILYQLLSKGDLPFTGEQDHQLLAAIFKGDYDDDSSEVWEDVPDEAVHLMEELLSVSPTERPSAKEASKRPWMMTNALLVSQ